MMGTKKLDSDVAEKILTEAVEYVIYRIRRMPAGATPEQLLGLEMRLNRALWTIEPDEDDYDDDDDDGDDDDDLRREKLDAPVFSHFFGDPQS